MAMDAVDKHLVRREDNLIQLLDPPFDKSDLNFESISLFRIHGVNLVLMSVRSSPVGCDFNSGMNFANA